MLDAEDAVESEACEVVDAGHVGANDQSSAAASFARRAVQPLVTVCSGP